MLYMEITSELQKIYMMTLGLNVSDLGTDTQMLNEIDDDDVSLNDRNTEECSGGEV